MDRMSSRLGTPESVPAPLYATSCRWQLQCSDFEGFRGVHRRGVQFALLQFAVQFGVYSRTTDLRGKSPVFSSPPCSTAIFPQLGKARSGHKPAKDHETLVCRLVNNAC